MHVKLEEAQGCSAERAVGTAHQIKDCINDSNKVSICLQEFPHWIFLFHCRLLSSSGNLRVTITCVRS